MVHTDPQILTPAQLEILQRAYLWSRIHGRTAQVSDATLEPDGRRRSKVIREAVAAGFLKEIGRDDWHGNAFEVTTQILRTVQPQEPNLQETWTKLYEKYSHRDAYTRPWIRFEDLLIAEQFRVIESKLALNNYKARLSNFERSTGALTTLAAGTTSRTNSSNN